MEKQNINIKKAIVYENIYKLIRTILEDKFGLKSKDITFEKIYFELIYILRINIKTLIGVFIYLLEISKLTITKKHKHFFKTYNNFKDIFIASLILSIKVFNNKIFNVNRKISKIVESDYNEIRKLEFSFLDLLDNNIYIKEMEINFIKQLIINDMDIRDGKSVILLKSLDRYIK